MILFSYKVVTVYAFKISESYTCWKQKGLKVGREDLYLETELQ